MPWPWKFQELTADERDARRLVLDRYGHYGFLLSVSPAAVVLVVRLLLWAAACLRVYASNYRLAPGSPGSAYPSATPATTASTASAARYEAIPDSPSLKSHRRSTRGLWETRLRRARWWLSDNVVVFGQSWGQRDEWLAGGAYTAVLLVLCTAETGRDYLHLTKRCGIVGISQLPLQYILAMRHVSPLIAIFRTPHEQINRWHRAFGAIVYLLLALHAVLYAVFFVQAPSPTGHVWGWLRRPVVVLGLLALVCMTALSTTALGFVRRWSYRLFFITHVLVAFALPGIVFLHAGHSKYYVAAALLLLIADITLRKLHTVTTQAQIEAIPGTPLVRLVAPIPARKMGLFRRHPASHVFVSLPHAARPTTSFLSLRGYWLFEMLFNPFTVASVNAQADDVTLVVRARDGPMSAALARCAKPGPLPRETVADGDALDDEGDDDNEETPAIPTTDRDGLARAAGGDVSASASSAAASGSIPVNLEGPYGTTAYFPELTPHNFDRVLLVAGGVGATFVVPLYRSIVSEAAAASEGRAPAFSPIKVDLVWSVRGAGEAAWAVAAGGSGERSLLEDKNVHIFLTGGSGGSSSSAAGEIELASQSTGTGTAPSRFASSTRRRPDLRQIVDDVFRHGNEERVAVVVCGPEAMAQELRRSVAGWVHKGRTVWWHSESFGW